jgi:hypothetical protein
MQHDIFYSPEEKWDDIQIQGQYALHFAKNLETGHRLFALFSGISICSSSAIVIFLCVSYFVERRRAHKHPITSDRQ